MIKYIFFILILLSASACNQNDNATVIIEKDDFYWWPKQPMPKAIVVCKTGQSHGENALAHSLAGIVAQLQKQSKVDELVWIEAHGEYDLWYSKLIHRTKAKVPGIFNAWQLLERYSGLVNGYILYQPETYPVYREDMDFSYHVAVSYAGTMQAIVIDSSMEEKAKAMGLKRLMDARNISREQCFEELKNKCEKRMIVTMNPAYHNNMDLAIANKALVTYGTDDLTEKIMGWMDPITPVVGWNHGDEDDFTQLPSKYGLFNTASDWCTNLIALSAGAENARLAKVKTIDPKSIDFNDNSHHHSFIMSDGDNMQWTIGAFVNNNEFWGSPVHGEFPMGFTSCPVNISMMAPDAYNELIATQPPNTTVIEYGGGYQYPDVFAVEKGAQREKIQREFARKVNVNMKRTGTKVFGFICMDIDSEDALLAYKIYAEEIEDLTGMIAIQYAPYHGGHGKVMWVKNKNGVEIPVVAARYSLWKNLNVKGGGDVTKIASVINQSVKNEPETMDFTIIHAWSTFENPANPQESGGGMLPVKWLVNRLDDKVKIVSPEELLWRIRMKHNKEETLKSINQN